MPLKDCEIHELIDAMALRNTSAINEKRWFYNLTISVLTARRILKERLDVSLRPHTTFIALFSSVISSELRHQATTHQSVPR